MRMPTPTTTPRGVRGLSPPSKTSCRRRRRGSRTSSRRSPRPRSAWLASGGPRRLRPSPPAASCCRAGRRSPRLPSSSSSAPRCAPSSPGRRRRRRKKTPPSLSGPPSRLGPRAPPRARTSPWTTPRRRRSRRTQSVRGSGPRPSWRAWLPCRTGRTGWLARRACSTCRPARWTSCSGPSPATRRRPSKPSSRSSLRGWSKSGTARERSRRSRGPLRRRRRCWPRSCRWAAMRSASGSRRGSCGGCGRRVTRTPSGPRTSLCTRSSGRRRPPRRSRSTSSPASWRPCCRTRPCSRRRQPPWGRTPSSRPRSSRPASRA